MTCERGRENKRVEWDLAAELGHGRPLLPDDGVGVDLVDPKLTTTICTDMCLEELAHAWDPQIGLAKTEKIRTVDGGVGEELALLVYYSLKVTDEPVVQQPIMARKFGIEFLSYCEANALDPLQRNNVH